MLKRQARFFQLTLLAVDNVVTAAAFALAILVRWWLDHLFHRPFHAAIPEYAGLLLLILPLWSSLFVWAGLYASRRKSDFEAEFKDIVKAVFMGTALVTAIVYLLRIDSISRVVLLYFAAASIAAISLERYFIRSFLRTIRRRGNNCRFVLIAGTGSRAREFADMLCAHTEWGLRVRGYVNLGPPPRETEIAGTPVVGTLNDLPRVLDTMVVDEVVFFVPPGCWDDVQNAIAACEEVGVQATVSLDQLEPPSGEMSLTTVEGHPFLYYGAAPARQVELLAKRMFDVVGAGLLLGLLAPVFATIAVVQLITSGRPILFVQERVGTNGRVFRMFKFRSMVRDAEARARALRHNNEMSGPVFKIRNDPRITPFGKLLRRTSLDELPQLFNVLKGEMSLVGPRPPLPSEVAQYKRWQRRRLSMRPGITGLWQVSGRNHVDFDQWMALDMQYLDKWSLWLDLRILLRTSQAVLRSKGAF